MSQPHDLVFKTVFEDPRVAAEHFEAVLPEPARRVVDLTDLELVPGSFVDEAFAALHTDLLFKASASDGSGRAAYVYLLFEHQSTADPLMAFRLYRYMGNIWSRHLDQEEGNGLPLPPIVALVLYNGRRRWAGGRSFHELVEPLGALAPRVPQFEMALTDLGTCGAELLDPETSGGRARLMLRNGPRVGGARALARLQPLVRATASDQSMNRDARLRQMKAFAHYLLAVARRVERAQVMDLFAQHGGEDGEKMVMSLRDELVAEGMAKGMAKGMTKGQAELLLKQLGLRFGAVDSATEERVRQASGDELTQWAERVLTADSLQAVLDG